MVYHIMLYCSILRYAAVTCYAMQRNDLICHATLGCAMHCYGMLLYRDMLCTAMPCIDLLRHALHFSGLHGIASH